MTYSLAAGRHLKSQFVACITHFLDFIQILISSFYSFVMNSMEINIISVTVIVMMYYFPQALGFGGFSALRTPCIIKSLTPYRWWRYFTRKKIPGHKEGFVSSFSYTIVDLNPSV